MPDTDRLSGGNVFDGGLIGEMGLKFIETPGNPIDGIDNDGDSDNYNTSSDIYDPENVDLYTRLTSAAGGFYDDISTVQDTMVRVFTAADFEERVINIGDPVVLIQDDHSRVIHTYDGSTFVSQGRSYDFGGAPFTVQEDLLPETDEDFGIHIDGLDNDFDGLIDENQPNHLTKSTYIPALDQFQTRPVRFINYLEFSVGDTLQKGLIVPIRLFEHES